MYMYTVLDRNMPLSNELFQKQFNGRQGDSSANKSFSSIKHILDAGVWPLSAMSATLRFYQLLF